MNDISILKEVSRLYGQKPLKEFDYYYFVLLGNSDGTIEHCVTTKWDGYTETRPRREIRSPRVIEPERMRHNLSNILNQPSAIINSIEDFYIFMQIGGHGIINTKIAEAFLPNWFKPEVCIQSHSKGYMYASSLPTQKTNHAPTKKVRMSVIKRDHFRCRICGRSPNSNVDIELHVHHIIPWGKGGITEEDNLITLCNTCHDGLDPHYEPGLFGLLGIESLQDGALDDFNSRVELYINNVSAAVRNSD